MVTGVIATPCTALLMAWQAAVGGGAATVTEQLTVPELPHLSLTVTV